MTTTADLYTLNNHHQETQDNTDQFTNKSVVSNHYHQDHRSSDYNRSNSNASNSILHLIEGSGGVSFNNNTHQNESHHHFNEHAAGSTSDHNDNDTLSTHYDALNNDFKPTFSSESVHLTPNAHVPVTAASSTPIKSNERLALSSIINTDDIKPNVNALISNFSPDLALDEDAPHEEEDDGTENESTYISHSMTTGDTYAGSQIDSNLQFHHGSTSASLFHSWTHAEPSNPTIEAKHLIPSPDPTPSQKKRKRDSANQSKSTKTPASSKSARPKSLPRVKSAEQLAREARIEQENPHATKNELRSLKLRALHAIRIAERELNMPEAEKQRRLRLREYVRQKRAEERLQKNMATNQGGSGRQSSVASGAHPTTSTIESNPNLAPTLNSESQTGAIETKSQSLTNRINDEGNFTSQQNNSHATNLNQFTTPQPCDPALQQACIPLANACQTESNSVTRQPASSSRQRQPKSKAPKNGPKSPKSPKSVSQARISAASLEAEIKKQNPNATPNQLKSLKLRALHAERIAEREQNMSEKEKLRRHKLREYMRRRRDEGRVEKGNESIELNPPADVSVLSDSPMNYRGSLDSSMNSEPQLHTNEHSVSGLASAPFGAEVTNAKERLAAFSMVEMTNPYHHHHFSQPNPNLHINPLFHVPMTQSSQDIQSPYDCSMHSTYALPNPWAHIPASDPGASSDEVAQKALHAALQEAVYMEPHHHDHHVENAEQQHQDHFPMNEEPLVETNRLRGIGHGEIRSAEDEIDEVARARELALMAAAAVNVDRAQQIQAAASSHLH